MLLVRLFVHEGCQSAGGGGWPCTASGRGHALFFHVDCLAIIGAHVADAYLLLREIVLLLRCVVLHGLNVHLGHLDVCNLVAVECLVIDLHWTDSLLSASLLLLLIKLLSRFLTVSRAELTRFDLRH